MPKRSRAEKHPTDTAGPARPFAELATGQSDHNTPEEDTLEWVAGVVGRKSEAARESREMADEKAEFDRLLEVRWENP